MFCFMGSFSFIVRALALEETDVWVEARGAVIFYETLKFLTFLFYTHFNGRFMMPVIFW